jgi:DNA repair ATPase RecN
MFTNNKQPPNSLLEISAVNKALSEHKELKKRVSDLEAAFIAQAEDLKSLRREVAAAFKQTGFSFADTSKAPVCGKW